MEGAKWFWLRSEPGGSKRHLYTEKSLYNFSYNGLKEKKSGGKSLRWCVWYLILTFSLAKGYSQCPTYASVDDVQFDGVTTGDATFYLSADNADSVYVWFGDGIDTAFKYTPAGSSITITHRYSLDNRYYYYGYYYAYFYFYNSSDSTCSNNVYTAYELPFQNKNCLINWWVADNDSLKASFGFYTYNSEEPAISVQLLDKKANQLDAFSFDYYSSDYMTPQFTFPKAGYDTLVVKSQGDYCNSTDTMIFYVYGFSCNNPTLETTQVDSVTFKFIIKGANTNSKYHWELSGFKLGSIEFETSDSTIQQTLPYDDQVSVWAYAYDSINNCYSSGLYTSVATGNQQCYAYFYAYIFDSTAFTYEFYNYSVEGKKYLWKFGDGDTSTQYNPGTHTYTKEGVYVITLTVSDEASGCVQTYEQRITVGNVPCSAGFSYNITGQTVTFTDQSSGAAGVYWDFDDGGWSYEYNPTHTYAEPGIYEVYQYIWNYSQESYCSDWLTKTITVGDINSLVKASFTYYTEDNTTFLFSDNSSGNVTQYYWTFGDGTTSTQKSVQKTYTKPGVYYVCLNVTNASGKVSSYCEYVWAGNATCNVAAKFSYRPNKDNVKVIEFTNSSQGNYDSYYWDFGDGSVSMEASPIHTYAKTGYYWVSLTTYNSQSGCMDTYYGWVQAGTVECKADFDYMVDAGTLTVTLQNKSKVGESTYYYWWFDDGDYSELANPTPKVFAYAGKHYIGLMIYDANTYCYDYTEKYIQVGEMACSAEFSYIVDTATNTIHCYNKSLGASTYLFWYFGDGSYSFESNPKHRFTAPGYYTVGLATYDDASGCIDYSEKIVQITGAGSDCVAEFAYAVDNSNRTVKFFDKSVGNIVMYLWNFGDGKLSVDSSPTNVYNAGGYYNVCLSVLNDKGMTDISCKRIKVDAEATTDCMAKFIFAIDSATRTVKFVSKSLGNPTSYNWDFGDNSKGTGDVATHQYSTPDYYLVGLTIATNSGCKSNAYQLINIGMPDTLKAAFAYKENELLKKAGGYPVDFIGAGLGDAARIKWTFGDGSTDSTTTTPTHVYSQPGTYEVCYEISDPITGAADKHCQMVTITGTKINFAQVNPFEVYPLPFSSELNIKLTLSKSGNVRAVVTDLSGRIVTVLSNKPIAAGIQTLRFNTVNLKRGTYLLSVETSDGTYQQLIIKQ